MKAAFLKGFFFFSLVGITGLQAQVYDMVVAQDGSGQYT
jgi:hypothetical protein